MAISSLVAQWKNKNRDAALHSYIFCLFLIGLPFTVFGNYVIYQLQVVGFLLGVDSDGLPCSSTYCLVPFGSRNIDLNSALLYLNAMGFGFGGVLAIFISAYADFWENKSVLVTIMIVFYGAVCIPVYWLRDASLPAFNALMALYVVYAVVTYIISALLNMYIPHCMRVAGENNLGSPSTGGEDTIPSPGDETNMPGNKIGTPVEGAKTTKPSIHRRYGFKMSIFGGIGTTMGGVLVLIVVAILTKTLAGDAGQTAGLLVTTVVGFLTIAGSAIAYLGLPVVPAKAGVNWNTWWFGLVAPFHDLLQRKNMLLLLLSYTIYIDTTFALSSVTAQIYFTEVKPDALEFTLYILAGSLFLSICSAVFYILQIWRPPFKLENWLILGYAMMLLVPIWGCIGLAGNINFGFKNRWEFYVQSLIFNLSGAIVNSTFRVLYSEMVPKGSEIEYFGLQVVLSCATAWVGYLTNAPLQNATHQLRFPLVLCLIFLVVPVVLETSRSTMKFFARDRLRWQGDVMSATTADDFNA